MSKKCRIPDKKIRELISSAEAQGWRVVYGNKHIKCYPPEVDRGLVVISTTPSDKRAYRNIKSDLERKGLVTV